MKMRVNKNKLKTMFYPKIHEIDFYLYVFKLFSKNYSIICDFF